MRVEGGGYEINEHRKREHDPLGERVGPLPQPAVEVVGREPLGGRHLCTRREPCQNGREGKPSDYYTLATPATPVTHVALDAPVTRATWQTVMKSHAPNAIASTNGVMIDTCCGTESRP